MGYTVASLDHHTRYARYSS